MWWLVPLRGYPGALGRRQAAIDDETGAIHVAGIVRGQEQDALGDIHRHAQAAAPRHSVRYGLTDRGSVVAACALGACDEGLFANVRLDDAWMDRIRADPIALARSDLSY